ncbi:MAG: hypothetical protein AAFQ44_06245 [Pseudomonadota bacterium]
MRLGQLIPNRFSSLRRGLVAAVILPATMALTGCYDQQLSLDVAPNGDTEATVAIRFDREMQEVMRLITMAGDVDPRAAMFLRDGPCRALEFAAALAPGNPFRVRATEGLQTTNRGEQYVCNFNIELGQISDLAQMVERIPDTDMRRFIQLRGVGNQQYELIIDIAALPDLTDDKTVSAIELLIASRRGAGVPKISRNQIIALIRQFKKANVALNTILYRNRDITFTFRAPEILSSNVPATNNSIQIETDAKTATEWSLRTNRSLQSRLQVRFRH